MSQNQSKRIWFVTGTSSGVGRELLDEILKSGQSVVATTRNAKALQEKLNEKYDAETLKRVLVVELDVTKVDDVKAAFAKGVDKFGRIDCVVNNAGYAVIGEVEAVPIQVAHDQFDVLYWGVYNTCKEAIRVFREVNPKGDGGHIFNISSFLAYSALPVVSTYCAAKFAVEGLSESLRKELLKEWKIQITIIQPGGLTTGWRNMDAVPILPAYDTDSSPAKGTRNMFLGVDKEGKPAMPFLGDATKVAKAFITLAEQKDKLPLRVQLGSDALAVVRFKAALTISDSEKFESISHSTSVDGMNGEGYAKVMVSSWS